MCTPGSRKSKIYIRNLSGDAGDPSGSNIKYVKYNDETLIENLPGGSTANNNICIVKGNKDTKMFIRCNNNTNKGAQRTDITKRFLDNNENKNVIRVACKPSGNKIRTWLCENYSDNEVQDPASDKNCVEFGDNPQ